MGHQHVHSGMGSRGALRIGALWYLPATGELVDAQGAPVHLRPQSIQVLAVLARNLGRMVSKDDLIAEVWPDVNVTDDSLVQCITEIRRAVGDRDRSQLRTFPKRGYLLRAGPVPPQGDDRPDELPNDIPEGRLPAGAFAARAQPLLRILPPPGAEPELARRLAGWLETRGLTILEARPGEGVLALAEAADQAFREVRSVFDRVPGLRIAMDMGPPEADPRAARLAAAMTAPGILVTVEVREAAVEPLDGIFADRGEMALPGEPAVRVFALLPAGSEARVRPELGQEAALVPTIAILPPRPARPQVAAGAEAALGDMLADDLIAHLSRSRELNVISRLSTARFANRDSSLAGIREALAADFVLSGRISVAGEQVVLMLELADPRNDAVLWADRLECRAEAMISAPEVVMQVAGQIRKAIVLSSLQELRRHALPDLRSQSLLFAAIGLMHRLTLGDFMTAERVLRILIDRAPDQPTPLAWLARWHVLRLQQGWSDDPEGAARAALDCARRALELDPENTLALTSEGIVLTNLWRRLDEAVLCYDAALEINPNDANARILRGMLYGYQGRGAAARADAERALHLAPLDPHRFFFLALAAGACIAAQDYPRALELSQQSLRMNRSHTSTLRGKIIALTRMERQPEARDAAQELLTLQPGFRVDTWLRTSPAADYPIGQEIAEALRAAGIPN
ncbi:hypothetical protein HCZ97_09940 [Pseudooceanicola sp. HF7]|nr:hypothetical protein [Pseudooceanicola sp. HF7]